MLADIFKGDSYNGKIFTNDNKGLVISDNFYKLNYGFFIYGDGPI
jgi:hypothetical protein